MEDREVVELLLKTAETLLDHKERIEHLEKELADMIKVNNINVRKIRRDFYG